MALYRLVSGIHEQKAAGSICVLGIARLKAGLTEQRGLLISRHTGNRNRSAEQLRLGLSEYTARRHNLRQQLHRNIQLAANRRIPLVRVNIKQHRARRIGHVCHMPLAARQIPNQPAIHRAKQQLAAFGAVSRARHVIKNPTDFRRGKIGIHEQTGRLADIRFQAAGAQILRHRRRSAALPDNRRCDGFSRLFIPDNGCLALIGDTNGGNLLGPDSQRSNRLLTNRALYLPDFSRRLFHPSVMRIYHVQLTLFHRTHIVLLIKYNTAGTGRACVNRKNILFHVVLPKKHVG